jgi:hypothetical protein
MNKKFKGFDVSIDDNDSYFFVNFDKNGKAGGYVSIKLDEEGIIVDIYSGEGDCIGTTYAGYEELEPTEHSHEDERL